MPRLSPEEKILVDIDRGKVAPVYALFSPQPSLLEPYLEALRRAVVPEGLEDFAFDKVSLDEATPADVATLARSVPMMVERKLVEVHSAQALFSSKTRGTEALLEYVRSPIPSTVLVLVFSAKPDKRTKVYKFLKEHAVVVEFDPDSKKSGVAIVRRLLREQGLVFSEDIPQMIYDFLGEQDMALAVEKLALYVGEGGTVTPEVVEDVVGHHLEGRAFKFIDALFFKDLPRALEELGYLRAEREEPLKIVALIARQIRLILLAKAGALPQDVARRPFMARPLMAQAKAFHYHELDRWQEALLRLDSRLKSSGIDGFTLLVGYVVECLG